MKREPIDLDLFEAKFSNDMRLKIESLGNSCGVMAIYILSLMYNIDFDFKYWQKYWNGTGMTTRDIIDYMESKGLNSFYIVGMRHNVYYDSMPELFKNGIAVLFAGRFVEATTNLPVNHISVLNLDRELIYAEEQNKSPEKAIESHMIVFFSKDKNISEFVKFELIQ
jgi:hypothetical protein